MKVYELEEKEEGVLVVSGEERSKAKRGTVKKGAGGVRGGARRGV